MDDEDLGLDPTRDAGAIPPAIVKSRYEAQGEKAMAHLYDSLYYMQHRGRGGDEGPEPRPLFTASGPVSSKQARKVLRARHDPKVLFHREILSPCTYHGLHTREDVEAWTRGVVETLGNYMGLDLTWAGVVHRNTTNPHAHVLIGGAAIRRRDGAQVSVRLTSRHFDIMRQSGMAIGLRMMERRGVTRLADQRRKLDAMVYRPATGGNPTTTVGHPSATPPTQSIHPVTVEEKGHESRFSRLFNRGR